MGQNHRSPSRLMEEDTGLQLLEEGDGALGRSWEQVPPKEKQRKGHGAQEDLRKLQGCRF